MPETADSDPLSCPILFINSNSNHSPTVISTLLRREFNRHGRFLKRLAAGVKGGIPRPSRLRQNGIDWMDEGDRENGLFGSDGKKMAYCSQFSQCPDSSQRTLTLNNDSGIEKSLDIRVLTQNDFCTPGVGGFPRRLRLVHGGVALAALRLTEGLHGELRCLEKRRKSREPPAPAPSSSGRLDMVGSFQFFSDRRFPQRHEEAVSIPLATADPAPNFGHAPHAGLQSLSLPSTRERGGIGHAVEEARLCRV